MTHRFFVPADQFSGHEVRFTQVQAHQLEHVLRLQQGDEVRVFDGARPCDLVVELISPETGRVVGEARHAPEPRTALHLYPALLQRDKFEQVLQKLTELGAAAITPIRTERGLVREPPDERRYARWRRIIQEAAEQSGRGRIPVLLPVVPLREALQTSSGMRVVAYEGERQLTLREVLRSQPTHLSLFVGPEGGFGVDEITHARDAGAHIVTLGPRVLRTETASPVLAALVLYELGDLSWRDHDH